MSATSRHESHEFKERDDPRYLNSCLVCGKMRKWHTPHAPLIDEEEPVPYITQARRALITPTTPNHGKCAPMTAGELTYQITTLLERYRKDRGDAFQTFADIVAACEQSKDEFRRRVVHPYEDGAMARNGDVYA